MSLQQDQFLDKYELTATVLGQGYFAVVKKGVIKKTGEPVAVKFVNKKTCRKRRQS
jgi:serine/threonine protein kinase